MYRYTSVFSTFCLVVTLASCKVKNQSAQKLPPVNKADKNTIVLTPVKPANEVYPYRPSATLKNDLLHTTLQVSFDWQKQFLNGQALLRFRPYFYPQDSLILDAKGMDIHEVHLVSTAKGKTTNASESLKYRYDGRKLRIRLDKTYTRKDSFEISIKYTAKPNELPKGGSQAITSDIGLYFINPLGADVDKPRQIWTQGETEAASCWFPTIDSPNERCTQEMFITVDTGFAVLSNGKYLGTAMNKNGTQTVHWKQDLPHAPYLFMMAIGKFSIVKDQWKDMEVNYYVEPQYEKYARNIFGNTPEMIQFFSEKLGYKFPWTKYSQVVVRDYVSGAMENTTATIFMEALQQDDRALADDDWNYIIAHELFHHWFGDLVTCESWSNLPLNESFANYSEYLWAEHKLGLDEADHHGENETDEYFEEARRKQVPLIRYHYNDREDMFDRHSYNKGGRILHMLRKYVGDEAFFASLKLYLERNQFTPVEVHDLRLAFEDVTGEDLNWFFNQWFLASGHPDLQVSHDYSGGMLKLTVKQLQDTTTTPIYKLPVQVDVWANGIKNTFPVTVTKREETFQFPLPAAPNLVLFDGDKQLLGKVNHSRSEEELLFQYKNYDRYLVRKEALTQLFRPAITSGATTVPNPFDNPAVKEVLMTALSDPFWAIRSTAIDQFSIYPIADINRFLDKIQTIALSDPKTSVRAKAIYLLSSYSGKDYIGVYKKAMDEKSYAVAGAGLSGYLKSGDSTVKINLPDWEKISNINIILPLAEYYVKSGTPEKFGWFTEKLTKGTPRVTYNLMDNYANYVLTRAPEKKEEAAKVLKNIAEVNRFEQIRNVAKLYLEQIEGKSPEE